MKANLKRNIQSKIVCHDNPIKDFHEQIFWYTRTIQQKMLCFWCCGNTRNDVRVVPHIGETRETKTVSHHAMKSYVIAAVDHSATRVGRWSLVGWLRACESGCLVVWFACILGWLLDWSLLREGERPHGLAHITPEKDSIQFRDFLTTYTNTLKVPKLNQLSTFTFGFIRGLWDIGF